MFTTIRSISHLSREIPIANMSRGIQFLNYFPDCGNGEEISINTVKPKRTLSKPGWPGIYQLPVAFTPKVKAVACLEIWEGCSETNSSSWGIAKRRTERPRWAASNGANQN